MSFQTQNKIVMRPCPAQLFMVKNKTSGIIHINYAIQNEYKTSVLIAQELDVILRCTRVVFDVRYFH